MNPATAQPNKRFLSVYRMRRGADFQRAYQRRCAASDGLLLLHAVENGLPHSRLGLSVSRKVGSAVVRNRWKRLSREAFRLSRESLPAGLDLVIIPKARRIPTRLQLEQSLASLARRLATRLKRNTP